MNNTFEGLTLDPLVLHQMECLKTLNKSSRNPPHREEGKYFKRHLRRKVQNTITIERVNKSCHVVFLVGPFVGTYTDRHQTNIKRTPPENIDNEGEIVLFCLFAKQHPKL